MSKDNITSTIEKHIGIYSETEGVSMIGELNLVSWNGREAKFDIRRWTPDHEKCSRGATLTAEELEKLYEVLKNYYERG